MIIHNKKIRKIRRVRGGLKQNLTLPRLSVFRSNYHIWAQIIDDLRGKTLTAASSKNIPQSKTKTSKIDQAAEVGKLIASQAKTQNITRIRFDKGYYHYHGRVKALAEEARKNGLIF